MKFVLKNTTETRKFKTLKKLICVLTFKKHKITEFIDFDINKYQSNISNKTTVTTHPGQHKPKTFTLNKSRTRKNQHFGQTL